LKPSQPNLAYAVEACDNFARVSRVFRARVYSKRATGRTIKKVPIENILWAPQTLATLAKFKEHLGIRMKNICEGLRKTLANSRKPSQRSTECRKRNSRSISRRCCNGHSATSCRKVGPSRRAHGTILNIIFGTARE